MLHDIWKRSIGWTFSMVLFFLCCIGLFLPQQTLTRLGSCSAFVPFHTQSQGPYSPNKNKNKYPKTNLFCNEKIQPQQTSTSHQDNDTVFSARKKMYLVSFPNYESSLENNNHQYTKRLWKWKDTVFGKGGIYFNSKIKASKAFHEYLKNQTMNYDIHQTHIDSCIVLSNCARMDILFCLDHQPNHEGPSAQQILNFISECIATQMVHFRKKKLRRILSKLPWDMPSMICSKETRDVNHRFSASSQLYYAELIRFLESNLVLVEGNAPIIRHFSLVSSGLASRPRYSKNDHPPVFRPFSSWDAHVMKQLKQSAEVSKSAGCSSVYTKLILDYALQAGKAARNTKIVPVLQKLQNHPSPMNDDELIHTVVQDVHNIAIEPTVSLCLSRMKALEASDSISALYQNAQTLLSKRNIDINSDEGKKARTILHGPVMQLRQGEKVNVNKVLAEIRIKLFSSE